MIVNENEKKFLRELETLLNRYGYDNECECPDFIIAEHLLRVLKNMGPLIKTRLMWSRSLLGESLLGETE